MSIHLSSCRVDGCNTRVCALGRVPLCRAARCVRSWWQMASITVSDISASMSSSPPLPFSDGGLFSSVIFFILMYGPGRRSQAIRGDKVTCLLSQPFINQFSFAAPFVWHSLPVFLSHFYSFYFQSVNSWGILILSSSVSVCLFVLFVCTSRFNIKICISLWKPFLRNPVQKMSFCRLTLIRSKLSVVNYCVSPHFDEHASLSWQAAYRFSDCGVKERTENRRINNKTFPNQFCVMQRQKPFLICQQSVVRSQWTPPPSPMSALTEEEHMYTRQMQRWKTFSLLWAYVFVCLSFLGEEKDSVWRSTQCMSSEKPVTLVLSLISVSGLLLSWNPASGSGSPYSLDITSLIEAHMQIKPVLIFYRWLHSQSASCEVEIFTLQGQAGYLLKILMAMLYLAFFTSTWPLLWPALLVGTEGPLLQKTTTDNNNHHHQTTTIK